MLRPAAAVRSPGEVCAVNVNGLPMLVLATLGLLGCPSRRPPPPPPPRAPEPVTLSLPSIRVSHAPWTQTADPSAAALVGRRGQLTQALAEAVLRSANEPVRACYKGFLAFNPQAAGSVTTLMRVDPDGQVRDVETVGSPDPSVALMMPCVLDAVRSRRFPPTRGSWLVSFPFVFSNGEVGNNPAPPVTPARPRPGEITATNPDPITVRAWRPSLTPNREPARAATQELMAESAADITSLVDTCYAAALIIVPSLAGNFTLRVAVEPSGHVRDLETEAQGMLGVGPWRDCIRTLGRQLLFHASVTGAALSVPVTVELIQPTANATPDSPGSPRGALLPVSPR